MPSPSFAVITLSAAPVASNGWDLSSELTIKTTSGALNVEPTSKASVSADKNGLSISATSTFYGAGKFEKPWLSLPTGGMATLHVVAAKSGVFLSTKEEFMRQLMVQGARSRNPTGTVLYIYHDDIGEVIGHVTAL